jgi:hypothetical protein
VSRTVGKRNAVPNVMPNAAGSAVVIAGAAEHARIAAE